MNKNGTLVDPIYDVHTEGEIESSHLSPTGLVQVYTFTTEDFQESGLYDGQYFFILKATNFTGKVTLTFVSSPKHSNERNYVDKFYIINNEHSINITNQSEKCHFFYAFPVVLKFSKSKSQIEPFQIPANMQTLRTADDKDTIEKLDQMTISIGQLICPKSKSIHRRYELTKFNRVSLNEAFQRISLSQPSKIDVSIGWDSYTDLDLLIFQVLDGGRLPDPICSKCKKRDSEKSIKSGGDSTRGSSRGDDETTTIELNKLRSDVKCLLICISSVKGYRFDAVKGTYIRIVDSETKDFHSTLVEFLKCGGLETILSS